MKPTLTDFAVVTATTDLERARKCLDTWTEHAQFRWPLVIVVNGTGTRDLHTFHRNHGIEVIVSLPDYAGVVPAFAEGLNKALQFQTEASVIACLHDDVEITTPDWDTHVLQFFRSHPACGLAGFGGGRALGHPAIYKTDYDPMQLARGGFVSNMQDAEAHGERGTEAEQVACLDGFSQIGRRDFWQGRYSPTFDRAGNIAQSAHDRYPDGNLFTLMAKWGIVHHAYDAALGCMARRTGWETWMIPIACHHYGGVTAVGDTGYADWADKHTGTDHGDHVFWRNAHAIVYEEFKDVLPF